MNKSFYIFSFVVLAFFVTVDIISLYLGIFPNLLYIGNTILWFSINLNNLRNYKFKKLEKKLKEIG